MYAQPVAVELSIPVKLNVSGPLAVGVAVTEVVPVTPVTYALPSNVRPADADWENSTGLPSQIVVALGVTTNVGGGSKVNTR